jgi:AraC-like DNA-binding protein
MYDTYERIKVLIMSRASKLEGKEFGRLVVEERVGSDKHNKALWLCRCDCGGEVVTTTSCLTQGHTTSCGCKSREMRDLISNWTYKHGDTGSVEFETWKRIKARCYNPKSQYYHLYGGKGIGMCERWLDTDNGYKNFLEDMGRRPDDCTSIERLDADKDYSPENCIWADWKTQSRNTSQTVKYEIGGEVKCLSDWAKHYGISRSTIQHRIKNQGMSVEEAIKTPSKGGGNRSRKTVVVYGRELHISDVCNEYGVARSTFTRWFDRGVTPEEIIEKYGSFD